MNACTDQLLLLLAPPDTIASLSYLSADPRISSMPMAAKRYPLNHGLAEEIIPLHPDLVVTGRFSARNTADLLTRLGYRVLDLTPAASLDDIRHNIRILGDAIGRQKRAAQVIDTFDTRLAALTAQAAGGRRVADYAANGMTSGKGTLLADIARQAGDTLLGASLGQSGTAPISLERLLTARPDLVVVETVGGAPSLATQNFSHPAFQYLLRTTAEVALPAAPLACGTPATLDVLAALVAARPPMPHG